jgi:hypothetical protein
MPGRMGVRLQIAHHGPLVRQHPQLGAGLELTKSVSHADDGSQSAPAPEIHLQRGHPLVSPSPTRGSVSIRDLTVDIVWQQF